MLTRVHEAKVYYQRNMLFGTLLSGAFIIGVILIALITSREQMVCIDGKDTIRITVINLPPKFKSSDDGFRLSGNDSGIGVNNVIRSENLSGDNSSEVSTISPGMATLITACMGYEDRMEKLFGVQRGNKPTNTFKPSMCLAPVLTSIKAVSADSIPDGIKIYGLNADFPIKPSNLNRTANCAWNRNNRNALVICKRPFPDVYNSMEVAISVIVDDSGQIINYSRDGFRKGIRIECSTDRSALKYLVSQIKEATIEPPIVDGKPVYSMITVIWIANRQGVSPFNFTSMVQYK